jgi:hypothetical protein
MPLKVWNGSTWQVQAQIKVWNGSSWVSTNALNNAKSARVWNGSAWVQFHPGVQLQEYPASGGTIDLNHFSADFGGISANSYVEIELNSSGTATYSYADQTTGGVNYLTYSWLLGGANTDYYAYMDAPSGDAFVASSATGTSLQLNTTRAWNLYVEQSGSGTAVKSNSSTLRIKNSAGTDIVSISTSFYVEANVL